MDIYDQATEREELDRKIALQHTLNTTPQLERVGVCHNCGEPLQSHLLFCDANCRDDWQLRNPAPLHGK